jgi:hypothetical protein
MDPSVSVAVKNSILLFLIIMCFHILIKNATVVSESEHFETSCTLPSATKKTAAGVQGVSHSSLADDGFTVGAPVPDAANDAPSCSDSSIDNPDSPLLQMDCKSNIQQLPTLKNDEEDLYQYVFGEPIPSSAACQSSNTASTTFNSNANCTSNSNSTSGKLTNNNTKGTSTTIAATKGEESSRGCGDASGRMIIGTYQNEKSLNGGIVFNGLTGYDGSYSQYEEL